MFGELPCMCRMNSSYNTLTTVLTSYMYTSYTNLHVLKIMFSNTFFQGVVFGWVELLNGLVNVFGLTFKWYICS